MNESMPGKLWSPDLFQKAISFAADVHKSQKVPGTDRPYLTHLANVAMEVMTVIAAEGVSEPDLALVCALLHDTIEDAHVSRDEITELFGSRAGDGVAALSKNPLLEKHDQLADSVRRIKLQPKEIWIVKMADRITNLQPAPHYWTNEKKERYKSEAEFILRELGEASEFCAARLKMKIDKYISL